MKLIIRIILTVIIILFAGIVLADEGVTVPYTFENGQVADADQINAVFDAIAKAINQNLIVMYDYGTPSGTSKVFEHTNSPTVLTSIVTKAGIETWQYSDGSKIEYLTAPSVEGTLDIGRREYNTLGTMTQDLTYFPAVIGVDLIGLKEVGKVWGDGTIMKKPDGSIYGTTSRMYTIIAIEDITVPAGTFTNCTKVYQVTDAYNSIAWYAEGVGMVKRIGVDGLMELQSVVTP